MRATLSDVADLCRDSLELADHVRRCGGPPPHRASEFDRAVRVLEGTLGEIHGDGGLGIAPLVLLGWVLASAGVITAVAVVPNLVRGSRQIVETVGSSATGLVRTTENVLKLAQYGALALGAYWAAKLVMKRTA